MTVIEIDSQVHEGITYSVDTEAKTCTCMAFRFRGACKHLRIALDSGNDAAYPTPKPPPPKAAPKAPAGPVTPPPLRSPAGRDFYRRYEAFAKTRLSRNFIMRDFLFSTHADSQGLVNYPSDDPDMVLRAGKQLCEQVMEPILERWGRVAITFGYESRDAIDGEVSPAKRKLHNSNPHQWDRGTFRSHIYARVDILPFCVADGEVSKERFGQWMMHNLDIDLLMMWKKSDVYCVTISPFPRRVWLMWTPQGQGEGGGNKRTYMGEDYWTRKWPGLPESERPVYGPSCTRGLMWWPKEVWASLK